MDSTNKISFRDGEKCLSQLYIMNSPQGKKKGFQKSRRASSKKCNLILKQSNPHVGSFIRKSQQVPQQQPSNSNIIGQPICADLVSNGTSMYDTYYLDNHIQPKLNGYKITQESRSPKNFSNTIRFEENQELNPKLVANRTINEMYKDEIEQKNESCLTLTTHRKGEKELINIQITNVKNADQSTDQKTLNGLSR